jgi:hypothetical protein
MRFWSVGREDGRCSSRCSPPLRPRRVSTHNTDRQTDTHTHTHSLTRTRHTLVHSLTQDTFTTHADKGPSECMTAEERKGARTAGAVVDEATRRIARQHPSGACKRARVKASERSGEEAVLGCKRPRRETNDSGAESTTTPTATRVVCSPFRHSADERPGYTAPWCTTFVAVRQEWLRTCFPQEYWWIDHGRDGQRGPGDGRASGMERADVRSAKSPLCYRGNRRDYVSETAILPATRRQAAALTATLQDGPELRVGCVGGRRVLSCIA